MLRINVQVLSDGLFDNIAVMKKQAQRKGVWEKAVGF